jgi:hypothetical protein
MRSNLCKVSGGSLKEVRNKLFGTARNIQNARVQRLCELWYGMLFTDGISVPGIKKWPGAGYGFSFHCWVQLDSIKEPQSLSPANYRRQLFK